MIAGAGKSAKLAVAAAARLAGVFSPRRRGLFVLMLHKVNDARDDFQLTLRPDLLDAMIAEMLKYGECIPFEAIDEAVLADDTPRFCITFDDGYRDNFTEAFPVLEKHAVPATIFLATDYIGTDRVLWYEELEHALSCGRPGKLDLGDFGAGSYVTNAGASWTKHLYALNAALKKLPAGQRDEAVASIRRQLDVTSAPEGSPMLNWDEIRRMQDASVSFGSHTASHPILSRETRQTVRQELRVSKKLIEERLDTTVDTFAYPNGTRDDYDGRVIEELESAGYRLACTTVEEKCTGSTSQFEVGRMHVHNDMCTGIKGQFASDLFWCKILKVF